MMKNDPKRVEPNEEGAPLNPIAVDWLSRLMRGIEPAIPPQAKGLLLPVNDLQEVNDALTELVCARLKPAQARDLRREAAKMRREFMAEFGGGLIQL
jgi:hypothetical protein